MLKLLFQKSFSTEYENKTYHKILLVGENEKGRPVDIICNADFCPPLEIGDEFIVNYNAYGKVQSIGIN